MSNNLDEMVKANESQPAEFDNIPHPKRHNLEPFIDTGKRRRLRQWMSILFIVFGIAGLLLYLYSEEKEAAKWTLLVALVFKFVEVVMRLLKM
jgi:hypothetical protein